jgi:two-component system CheB/CheR fusion protein
MATPAKEPTRAQLTAEVKRLEEALSSERRRTSEFLAQLAHELRNPLGPILSGLEAMQIVGLKDPTLESLRELMRRQTDQLIRLVDDLFDVSRVTHGRITLEKERIDVATVVAQAIETTRDLIAERRHSLAVDVPPQPIPVDGDAVRLQQVFVNLLSNAARYSPEGGRIWLSAARDGSEAVISIRDEGQGISAEALPRIFDPFFRSEAARQTSGHGLGVGLSLVHSLVQLHGGRVQVMSDGPGKGSEFVVTLPLPGELANGPPQ